MAALSRRAAFAAPIGLLAAASTRAEQPRPEAEAPAGDLLNRRYGGAGMSRLLAPGDQLLMLPVSRFRWDGLYATPLALPEGAVDVWRVQVIGRGLLRAKKDDPDFADAAWDFDHRDFARFLTWQVAGYARITDASVLARVG